MYINESFVQVIKIMRAKVLFLIGIILLCVSCKDSSKRTIGSEVYKVNLNDVVNPFDEIFFKAEIIPLETVDSSMIAYMQKIYLVDGHYYIYDFWLQNLLVFDQTGQFVRKVGKRGDGPDEYRGMYDCYVDVRNKEAYYLSVYGRFKRYYCNGEFRDEVTLPTRPHYYSMSMVDENHIVTWSCLEPEDGGGLQIADKMTGDSIRTCWYDDRVLNFQQMFPFYSYNGKTFFSTALRHQVYEVTVDGLLPAYIWDFGKHNITEGTLEYYLSIEGEKRNQRLIDDCGTDLLPYCFREQNQNARYCYASLRRDRKSTRPPMTHVFYDKKKQEGYAFDELADGCRMNFPLYFGDDYMLTDVFYENREQYKSILPESEYKKLENMKEDDNPYLLKLYFK